jgi:Tol biopolymer transport system component
VSPDERWIAITKTDPRRELWLYPIGGAALTPLSRTDEAAFDAVWAPDSKSVVYSHENPVYDLHSIPIDGSSLDKPVVASKWDKYGMSISPDGKSIAYIENDNSDRILIAPMDGSAAPRPLTVGATSQRGATFSPDGRWIAYEELSHGRPDVYVTSAEGSGGRRQVSVEGGEQPRWTKRGREIVYRRGDAMLAASVDPSSGRTEKPVELFRKTQPYRLGGGRTYTYDVAPDGNRFLLVIPMQKMGAQPTVVTLNWLDKLKNRSRPGGASAK